MDYELVVGLEVHIQLNTKSKMFCGCQNDAENLEPNTAVCPVCFGMPGTLPVANKEAIRKTLVLGIALESTLAEEWNFERKSYFYPDLPKGYQITSATRPPLIGGRVQVPGSEATVRIHHVHLEEDAGKLIHAGDGFSYVDLNRAGTPLIELVTEPDIRRASDARAFLKELQHIARLAGISEADMEKGHMRADANVSVHKPGTPYGKKVEVKNVNSWSMVEKAINYEYTRQVEMLEAGHEVAQETRSWDDAQSKTVALRSKEEAQDYRYIPEPDMPPFVRKHIAEFSDEHLQVSMPELPHALRSRLTDSYGLTAPQAEQMVEDMAFRTFGEAVLKNLDGATKEMAVKILFGDVVRVVAEKGMSFNDLAVEPADIVKIVALLHEQVVTHQIFKANLLQLLTGAVTVKQIEEQGKQSRAIDIDQIVKDVLESNPTIVEQWKAGSEKVFGFLVGQVMAKTRGQANPQKVNELLHTYLEQYR